VTATDLLFAGDTSTGRFMAIDATNGEIAWSFRVGQSFQGSSITYIGPDGRQYIAVIGSGESTGNVDPADGPNADERYWRAGSNLYVFALPETVAGN
jgi:outer membrane protein assembly factor BamB